MFEGTKAKVDTLINDKVTQPIKLSMAISVAALIMAGISLIVVVTSRANR